MRLSDIDKNVSRVTEGMLDNPGEQDSPVAQAIIRRILLQRTDLLSKYGPEKVGQAVDEVADFVGDVDEIGSSDVSGWIRHVEQMLGNMGEGVAEGDDIQYHQTSGTKAGHTISSRKLSNKPQASKSDVTLQSGSMHHSGKSYNFPKGTLFTQLPGGIFAKHPSVPETHPGFGHLIRRSEDNIRAIHNSLNGQQGVAEVSKATLNQYVPKAVDAHGHADFSARMSKDDPTKRSYHVDQKHTAEKRRQGISRALDRMSKMEGVAEAAGDINVGDDVIVTGAVKYKGATGVVDSIGRDGNFIVVNLYNHGKQSFQSTDVSPNDYAGSEAEESEIQRREMGESNSRSALGKAIRSSNIISEAAKGHTVEAHGVKGMNNKAWRKTFKNAEQAYAWAEKNDAEVKGTRDLEAAKTGNLSPAVKEGAKVDRMVKHITKSEKAAGKSSAEAEDIAWATANKRGMLDNKNKKTESTKARASKKY